MIYKVSFHADIPGKKIGKKLFGKLRFLMKQCDHSTLFDANNNTLPVGTSRGHAERLPRQTTLTKETGLRQNGNHCLLARLRYHCELHFATLNEEDRIRSSSLRKDQLFGLVFPTSFSNGEFRLAGGVGSNEGDPF